MPCFLDSRITRSSFGSATNASARQRCSWASSIRFSTSSSVAGSIGNSPANRARTASLRTRSIWTLRRIVKRNPSVLIFARRSQARRNVSWSVSSMSSFRTFPTSAARRRGVKSRHNSPNAGASPARVRSSKERTRSSSSYRAMPSAQLPRRLRTFRLRVAPENGHRAGDEEGPWRRTAFLHARRSVRLFSTESGGFARFARFYSGPAKTRTAREVLGIDGTKRMTGATAIARFRPRRSQTL